MEDRTGEQFVETDFTGARFRGVILADVTITDALLFDVDISGLLRNVTINGVDVGAYVDAELDRRHPERLALTPDDADGVRVAWATVESFAAATLERARRHPPEDLDASVGGEWSYLETLRHLVYATDRWISGPLLGDDTFHRLGRPNDPLDEFPTELLDLDARPSLDEVVAVRRERMDRVASFVRDLDDGDLARVVVSPNGVEVTVLYCLQVLLREEWGHDQYANRDLAALEAAADAGG